MSTTNGLLCLWKKEPLFLEVSQNLLTLIDNERLFMIFQALRQVSFLPGDTAECGVYRGGSALMMARLLKHDVSPKKLHLFDTFAGMPETNASVDLHHKGDFADTSLEQVKNYLAEFSGTVSFYPGPFRDTFIQVAGISFSFVHVDCDIYESALQCCSFFYPRLQPGGIMIYDDYGFPSCPGAKLAVDEFYSDKPEKPLYLPTGQAMVIKCPVR